MSAPEKKLALVIAINYKGSPYELSGCEKDGTAMRAFFDRLGYTTTLMSATSGLHPTKAAVTAKITEIAGTPGLTKLSIFYAGHGSQLRDASGDEADGQDEAIVCQGRAGPSSAPTTADFLTDDELIGILHTSLRGRAVQAFLMFDACHSGSVLDLGWELSREGAWLRSKDRRTHTTAPEDKYVVVCLSGAQDYECALETAGGGNMTNKFLQTAQKSTSLADLNAAFFAMSLQCPRISASAPLGPQAAFATEAAPPYGAPQTSSLTRTLRPPARPAR